MKKQNVISMFLLFAFSILLVGCGNAEEVTAEKTVIETTTSYLVESHTKVIPKIQEVVVSEDANNDVYLRNGVNAIVEFYNSDEDSKRLVIYDTDIDLLLRPNERAEVKINAQPQTIEYVFGDDYKQIIIV